MAPARSALAGLSATLAILLPRMRREFNARGQVSTATAATMEGCYVIAAGIYGDALRRGEPLPPLPRAVALSVATAGAGFAAAGMAAFDSASQVVGKEPASLAVGGVYRFSRNPQYVGFVIAGAAGAIAYRSPVSLALTAAYGCICRWWVPVEERALERQFGDDYRRFRSTTPRWLTLRPRRHKWP